MKSAMCFLILLIHTLPIFSQDNSSRLKSRIDSLITARYPAITPGCVVLVAEKSEVTYLKAFGEADLKTKLSMKPDMVFRLGSITKQYTAIAILQLVEAGKIKLQDSIQVYVKDFPHKTYPVTIQNLLTHTSGIINFQSIVHPDPKKVRDNYTPAEGVDYFKDEPLQFKPGSRFEYSNSNYELLGYIIELVTGETYGRYIEQHLLAPAGLQHTYYLWPGKPIPDMASGYSRFGSGNWEKAELQNVTMLYAAGGLAANAFDVWKWHQELSQGKLISKELLDSAYMAFQPTTGLAQYGYGWFNKEIDGEKTIEHSGSTDGYQTDEVWIPQKYIFVVALFNGFKTDMDWQVLTNDIVRLAIGHGLRSELKLNEDSLERFVGTYSFNKEHGLVISLKDHQLYVEATNAKDKLPKLPLFAQSEYQFYIKEAPLRFVFSPEPGTGQFMITTYNSGGKDGEWKKIK